MDISQAELDAKLEAARTEAASAKEAELKAQMERVRGEAEAKTADMQKNATQKVSEHAQELGTLRKFKQDTEPQLTELTGLRTKVQEYESVMEAERRKAEAAAAKKPTAAETLKTMTDPESAQLDALIESLPEDKQALFADPKTGESALSEALEELRQATAGKPTGKPATAWRERFKATQTTDPDSMRQIIRAALKEKSGGSTAGGGTGGKIDGKGGKGAEPERFVSMRESAFKKKD